MKFYRRRLPHRDIPGAPVFVTWCLFGSLPKERTFFPQHLTTGEAFVAWDKLLDAGRTGARWLAHSRVADLVTRKLLDFAASRLCDLDSFVIMPNHVHVLWTPNGSLADLIRRVKGGAALEANRLLGRVGQKFWQDEYFDRGVRDEHEMARIRGYIEWNPVKAGLVSKPEDFLWSSARLNGRERAEGPRTALTRRAGSSPPPIA